jgi:hypothetical protein
MPADGVGEGPAALPTFSWPLGGDREPGSPYAVRASTLAGTARMILPAVVRATGLGYNPLTYWFPPAASGSEPAVVPREQEE